MNIVEVLRDEEATLERQLAAIKNAIAALNGVSKTAALAGHRAVRMERAEREPCPLRLERK